MWRAYDAFGFLQYSFADSVAMLHPYYVVRALGGFLYLLGALLMAFNFFMTIRGSKRRHVQSPKAWSPEVDPMLKVPFGPKG
jgi:cytochrome c oxidase cbb3-type subunit 1